MNVVVAIDRTLRHWFSEGVFRRIFKNAGLMLTGRVATGVLSLATLSLSARGLGVDQFGVFVLIQTYAQVIGTVMTLQSYQAVIRYGAICLRDHNRPALQALLKLLTALDFAGGLIGGVIAYFIVPLVGPHVGWSDEVIRYAQPFSLVILFSANSAPTGLLRLLDRFDLLAVQTTITPLFRLLGVGAAVILDAPFWTYLLAWLLAQVVGDVVLICLAWREAYRGGWLKDFTFSMRGLTVPHEGVVKFSVLSSIYTSLQMFNQMTIFLVGALAGPAAAGIYKIGRDASTVLSKPADLLNQSIYPEFARLGSHGSWQEFARLILRGAAVAAAAGGVMIMITALFGAPFVRAFFGEPFASAYVPLVLLVAAAGIAIVGFPLDVALFAMGQASIPLRVSTGVIVLVQLPMLIFLTKTYGPVGAAVATVGGAIATLIAMTAFTARQLRARAVVI